MQTIQKNLSGKQKTFSKFLYVFFKFTSNFEHFQFLQEKYSLLSRDNSVQISQMHLSEKEKTLSQYTCAFFKSTSNFQYFQKKMTLIAYEFRKLRTPKNVVR